MQKTPFNDGWDFYNGSAGDERERVRLPHTNAILSYNYACESDYQGVYTYEHVLYPDESWRNKAVILTLGAVAHKASAYLNGELIAEHSCGYTAFEIDLTGKLKCGEKNVIHITADSRETLNIPPFGGRIDYLTYGGMYREAYIEIGSLSHITDVFVRADHTGHIKADTRLSPHCAGTKLRYEVISGSNVIFGCEPSGLRLDATIEGITPWSIYDPMLYTLRTVLTGVDGSLLDEKTVTFGFRTCTFKADGFYLNGERVLIRGLNRHQCYPYVGYAMPKGPQVFDAHILKYELGLNAVRTAHYPQSQYFIDECDRIGLLVFTEIPGWQHIGDRAWQETARINAREMVMQYRNHPSIVLWGVRINESKDCDELYRDTNALCRSLDDSRMTSGVRCIKQSGLLEDVYSFNDFSHNGKNAGTLKKQSVTRDKDHAFLVTEYNGHMFPTKSFDDVRHRTDHALRHAAVLASVASDPEKAGSFGWCFADYNTHRDFGSGDGVCYHGVTDMFRNPKCAAHVYASQAETVPVIAVSSTMDLGDYAGFRMEMPVYAFTNADSVRVYRNGEFTGEFSASEKRFEGLTHPPIVLDDLIGDSLEKNEGLSTSAARTAKSLIRDIQQNGYEPLSTRALMLAGSLAASTGRSIDELTAMIERYVGAWGTVTNDFAFAAIKDGKEVARVTCPAEKRVKLGVSADRTYLHEEDTYDVACVRILALDSFSNVLPYAQIPVKLDVEGDIELIGPKLIALAGGMGGTYVRTVKRIGKGRLTVSSEGLLSCSVDFVIE